MIAYNFSGRNIIVTGGTRGIGRAISEAFLAAGARVVATYAGNREAAEVFAAANVGHAERLVLEQFDISDHDAVEAFYRRYEERTGKLDVLVNNAGIRRDSVVGMMLPEDWQRVVDINLTGTYNMSKYAVHAMLPERWGRIITITSPSGEIGFEGQANYAATKAGQIAFTKSLAKEVAKRKITVNCVSPGFIDTEFIADLTAEQAKAYKGMVPMKRFGETREVAEAVLFLASDAAAYITAETLHVTGGV